MLHSKGALPCVLGGLSMGGYIALAFVARFGGDLKGLILVDTRAEADTPPGKQARDAMIELARAHGSPAIAEQMLPRLLMHATIANRPEIVRKLRDMMEACPADTIQYALAAMRDREDSTPRLGSIAIPTLIIVGQQDTITPPNMSEALHRGIHGSILRSIPHAAHVTPLEQPARVTQAIEEFMRGIGD